MSVRTRIDNIERDIGLMLAADLSPEAMAREFAAFARQERDKALQQNTAVMGRAPQYETYVDGKAGVDESAAKVPGTIAYEFELGTEVVQWVWDLLLSRAPKQSGRYRASIWIYADGVKVPGPAATNGAAEIVIVSTTAYSRKIEGRRAGGAITSKPQGRAPQDGVFEGATLLASRRFGNVASIKFTFAVPRGGGSHLEEWASGRDAMHVRAGQAKGRRMMDKDRRNPAIAIRFR